MSEKKQRDYYGVKSKKCIFNATCWMHIGEVLNLKIKDIDFTRQLVYIQDGENGKFRSIKINMDGRLILLFEE